MLLMRINALWLLLTIQSILATCEFRLTGLEALKRNPPVFRPSPCVLSLAGYLCAASDKTATAAGLIPTAGHTLLLSCAGVNATTWTGPQIAGFVGSSQCCAFNTISPKPMVGSGTVRTTDSLAASRRPS